MSIIAFPIESVNVNAVPTLGCFIGFNLSGPEIAALRALGVTVQTFGTPQIYVIQRASGTSHTDLVSNIAVVADPVLAAAAHDALDNAAIQAGIDPGGAFALSFDGLTAAQTFNDLSIANRAAQQCHRKGIVAVPATRESPDGKQYVLGSKVWIDPAAAPKAATPRTQDLSSTFVLETPAAPAQGVSAK